MKFISFFSFLLMLLLTSCTDTKDANKHWQFSPVLHPEEAGASSRFYQNQAGHTWISWVAYLNDSTDALQYSPWEGDKWGAVTQNKWC